MRIHFRAESRNTTGPSLSPHSLDVPLVQCWSEPLQMNCQMLPTYPDRCSHWARPRRTGRPSVISHLIIHRASSSNVAKSHASDMCFPLVADAFGPFSSTWYNWWASYWLSISIIGGLAVAGGCYRTVGGSSRTATALGPFAIGNVCFGVEITKVSAAFDVPVDRWSTELRLRTWLSLHMREHRNTIYQKRVIIDDCGLIEFKIAIGPIISAEISLVSWNVGATSFLREVKRPTTQ